MEKRRAFMVDKQRRSRDSGFADERVMVVTDRNEKQLKQVSVARKT